MRIKYFTLSVPSLYSKPIGCYHNSSSVNRFTRFDIKSPLAINIYGQGLVGAVSTSRNSPQSHTQDTLINNKTTGNTIKLRRIRKLTRPYFMLITLPKGEWTGDRLFT